MMKRRSNASVKGVRKNAGRKFSLSDYSDGEMCRCCAIKGILEVHSSLSSAEILEHFQPQEADDVRANLRELIKTGEVKFDGNVYRLTEAATTTQPERF